MTTENNPSIREVLAEAERLRKRNRELVRLVKESYGITDNDKENGHEEK